MILARIPLSLLTHPAVFIFFFLLENSLCVDLYFETCSVIKTCGGLNISFPFYIDGEQERSCGYLGFQVFCIRNTTIFTISDNPYIIREIFYENQTVRVSNALASGCLPLGRELLLPNQSFELAHPEGTDHFLFLSNCSTPLPDYLVRYQVNCSGDDDIDGASQGSGLGPVLAMSKGDPNLGLASEKCRREVEAPFEEKADDDGGIGSSSSGNDLFGEELVWRGFTLKWKASDCNVCSASGGKCGFNFTDYHFQCFCPDRPHAKHCVSGESKHPPNCPRFYCEKLGSLRFPFNNKTNPECGLCTIVNCSEETPKIQMERGGRYFGVKNISRGDTIVIQDEQLQERLKQGRCDSMDNLTSSPSPVSFTPAPSLTLLTMFKCKRNHSTNLATKYTFDSCHDFIIHYNHPNHTYIPPSPSQPPPNCSVIEYPVNTSLGIANLFSLLTSDITLEVHVLPHCWDCHNRGGLCQYDEKGKFQCAHVKGNDQRLALGLGISGGSLIVVILTICLFMNHLRQKKKYTSTFPSRNTSSDRSSTPGLEVTGAYFGIPIFPYSELEEATNYFDPGKEIGDGGFGTVYHGQLRDGREVAVKRLYENNYRRVEQFMNEVKILTRLRHQNLVSLYGCTSRRSRELLLVYEFVPNGTVADHLHGDRAGSGLLTWPVRLNIAIETASALCYLHASDVVHRDVKTNNILLDDSFSVKVADFGLSRLFPLDVTHVSTAPQGTPGYVDPEYHQCYQLTEKSDVYSFGVVLIELISSLPAVDISRHRSEINLSNYAINKIQKSAFQELIDPHLGFDSDVGINRMTTLVAELAFRCLQPEKETRPSMDEVLEKLKEMESDKHELGNMDVAGSSVGSSMSKLPPPSPECDEVRLLKSVPMMPSPDTVTAQWPSRSTTPNTST